MRLAVSNIAWPADAAQPAYDVLAAAGVAGLEIAPGLLFADAAAPFDPPDSAVVAARAAAAAAGLTFCSMQSLLFGVEGAALFGDAAERAVFARAMLRAIRLAERLGIANLVVGSPRNRVVPPDMSEDEARAIAADTFRALGESARTAGCVLAMEPNPAVYGTNFLTTLEETDAFVRLVGHPAVTVNFDVGALHVNGAFDRLEALLALARPRISHVHLSEPGLAPFPRDAATARRLTAALAAAGWDGYASIEMRADPVDPIGTLRRSVDAARAALGDPE
ncbi:sugar phosphate isomerase/epimerase family protein [Aquabacter spiritensis]|uniref:Sugar phosphate isomerase/epimerase n=1 Tax=Aquabacter spiritensis TaxID=933073 RepID=A0A4R3LZJ4_9HYPH|nr:sugar phosphate isomerase/epimerase family protein [Aquabacter spiritensis]TCT06184.1 sugar phosphate isomerase/epimerase [Aquabacter spiritensis]